MDIKYLRFFYDEVTLLSCLICRHSVWFRDLIFTFEVSGLNCYFSGNIEIWNVDCWDIKILSYSVAFIKKINLLHLHHWHFPRKSMYFSEAATRDVLCKKAVLKHFAIFTGKLQTCNFIKKRLQHRSFPLSIAKFLRTCILKSSGNCWFWIFKTATKHRWAATSILTLLLSSDNSVTGYEQLSY